MSDEVSIPPPAKRVMPKGGPHKKYKRTTPPGIPAGCGACERAKQAMRQVSLRRRNNQSPPAALP